MKIVIDSAIPFIKGVFEPFAKVAYIEGGKICSSDVAQADALIIRTRTICNEALLGGSAVKIIATATIGTDHIDFGYCNSHSIKVVSAAGCNARGVLQWVAAALAQLSKLQNFNPTKRTIGVVGVGHVGSLVAQYCATWGFNVICCDPPRQKAEHLNDFIDLEQLLHLADIITFHTPYNATTHHLLGTHNYNLLKNGAVILNAARGGIVDTGVLLKENIVCGIDTWEGEPNIDLTLLDKAFVATPHIAGYSLQGKANGTAMVVKAVAEFFNLPISNWYPSGISHSEAKNISWENMHSSIGTYFDIEAESKELKKHPADFEKIRNNYSYRVEYF